MADGGGKLLRFRFPEHDSTALRNMDELRRGEWFCDVTVLAGGLRFPGHRVVLAACSPFLRDRFRMEPAREVTVLPATAAPQAVLRLLLACYTGRLEFPFADILDYLTAASCLQMEDVVEQCRRSLSPCVVAASLLRLAQDGGGGVGEAEEGAGPAAAGAAGGGLRPGRSSGNPRVGAAANRAAERLEAEASPLPRPTQPPGTTGAVRGVEPVKLEAQASPPPPLLGPGDREALAAPHPPPPPAADYLETEGRVHRRPGLEVGQGEEGGDGGDGEEDRAKAEGMVAEAYPPGTGAEEGGEEEPEDDYESSASEECRASGGFYGGGAAAAGGFYQRPGLGEEPQASGLEEGPGPAPGAGGLAEPPLLCSECGAPFEQRSGLAAHLLLHKLYMCPLCGKLFKKNARLAQHLNVHTGFKPYGCAVCGRAFTQNRSLKDHMNVHSGDSPHSCGYCDMRFTHYNTLRVHLRDQHGKTTSGKNSGEPRLAEINVVVP
ncbi:zinc finger and BTB domain-containing protein 12-like [Hemiscyllium ocellatum]|uniref:zinc finger and BTB domain-containing protein 12-like n=1 Tax=Hemiscyllium ocellatum TaxID=170820 RepID=UPI00296755F5|nr:zinc finger and BTB domain-containing protein 12-like [Hemiscyllium ocellatum]